MPFDSNGNASITRQRAVTGQTVLAEQVNVPFDDVQSMFNQTLLRSGVAPMTGSLNLNGFKMTNSGDASSDGDLVSLGYLKTLIDPWALKLVGEVVACDMGEGLPVPSKTNPLYRYVQLTAGLTGAGAYNEGILTTETVTGTDPTIVATAVVTLTGSPLNGKTIRLLNTERRFVRPGVAGTLEDSQNAAHVHGITDPGHAHTLSPNIPLPGADTDRGSGSSLFSLDLFQAVAPTNPSTTGITINSQGGLEARPRSIGAVYFRRIL